MGHRSGSAHCGRVPLLKWPTVWRIYATRCTMPRMVTVGVAAPWVSRRFVGTFVLSRLARILD